MRILALDGSPTGGGRTAAVLEAVLLGAAEAGATTEVLALKEQPNPELLGTADGFVFGTPVHRASFATPMKQLLDGLPRGMWGEQTAPITGRAVAIVATGASWHHYLALDDLRNVLAGFFAAQVLSPGLYVPREGFSEDGALVDELGSRAKQTGRALVEFTQALERAPALRSLTPQA